MFLAALDAFVGAVEPLDDHAFLAATHCWGWAVVDVVTHVRTGLEEAGLGLLAAGSSRAEPDVDAATYWRTQPPANPTDAVAGTLAVRRVASATRAPGAALGPLRAVADTLRPAVLRLDDGVLDFQTHVLTTGDFLATWAVELAVHQLDLGRDLDVARPDPGSLALARRTVEALVGTPLPPSDDADAVLLGTGRRPPSDDERARLGAYADHLPAF